MRALALFPLIAVCGSLPMIAACGSTAEPPVSTSRFSSAPAIAETANNAAPLARVLTASTLRGASLSVRAEADDGHRIAFEFASDDAHDVTLLGFRAGRSYSVSVTAVDAAGTEETWPDAFTVETESLPADFPPIEVAAAETTQMEPGFTLFNANRIKDFQMNGRVNLEGTYVVIVDAEGEPVWYFEKSVSEVQPLGGGELLLLTSAPPRIERIDMRGRSLTVWQAILSDRPLGEGHVAVETSNFHHDVERIGDNLLVTTGALRRIDDFPVDELDVRVTETATVRDDPIVEFTPAGEIVNEWPLLDLIKPTRVGFDATRGHPVAADWAHVNAATYDESDDSILVSARHQDAVIKFSRATGELEWILGNHANWEGFESFLLTPTGEDFVWPYHQHAPQVTPSGTVILFDNGNNRASPFTGEVSMPAADSFSRAVEYRIDETTREIAQVWQWAEYADGEQLYAPFVGDADVLPESGNVLMSFAGLCTEGGVRSDQVSSCDKSVRIIEVTHDPEPLVVFELRIDDPDYSGQGWISYRSDRIRGLFDH